MNRAGASKLVDDHDNAQATSREAVDQSVDRVYDAWLAEQWAEHLLANSRSKEDVQEQVVFSQVGKGMERDETTMGYVTHDLCPGKGDDIEHVPGKLPTAPLTENQRDQADRSQYRTMVHNRQQSLVARSKTKLTTNSDFFSSPLPSVATDDELIDVVICDFALDDFCTLTVFGKPTSDKHKADEAVSAVNKLAPALNLTEGDMKPYAAGVRTNELWGKYARKHWT